ncbi:MAG: hypothetical protein HZA52_17110 [Planctomycetes bacterium]|nr:hypothetical protein [Planctomycetota bacterium]
MTSDTSATPLTSVATRLCAAWGKLGLELGAWPVPHDLPADRDALARLIDVAPASAFELVHAADGPAREMPKLSAPQPRSRVLDADWTVPFVVRVGPLLPWAEPLADWPAAWRTFLRHVLSPAHAERCEVRIDLYIASPHAYSRFHADPSHNVVHQIVGRRELRVFSPFDRRLIDERSRPEVFHRRGCVPLYREDCEDAAVSLELSPGTASYIPALGAHWLRNGAKRSVAYGISLRTPSEFREKHCHAFNRRLGALGLAFAEFGLHQRRDSAKAAIERWLLRRSRTGGAS